MVRHTIIVYMYEETPKVGYDTSTRILEVYQNRHPKECYIEIGWDEEEIEKIKLSKEKLNKLW